MLETSTGIIFGILGSLRVDVASRQISITSGKQRILLTTLLLNANETVPAEELVERLWSDNLPNSPRSALQTYLTRLRKILHRNGEPCSELIRTFAAGYAIRADAESFDLLRFRRLIDAARGEARRSNLTQESTTLAEALSLWRGRALHDVPSESLQRDVVPTLTEEWLRATERYNGVMLALGRPNEIIAKLRVLIRSHPFHERFRYQFMLALHRCGRRFEALQAYRELREHLHCELGVDPSPELADLHLMILRNEPDSAPARDAERFGHAPWVHRHAEPSPK